MKNPDRARGFSLLELAVAVFIMTLLLGGILMPLQTSILNRKMATTEKQLNEIHDAILGYAAANGYLPCPDLTAGAGSGDGNEDISGIACAANSGGISAGSLPWATLGTGATDPWGNRYRYVVQSAFASRAAGSLTLSTAATLKICPYAGCAESEMLVLPYIASDPTTYNNPNMRAAVVIISHGPNGLGALNGNSSAFNPNPTGADELANLGTNDFVSRVYSEGNFDDVIHWIGRPLVFSMLVKAGRLP